LPLIFTELGYESATDAASQPFGTSTNSYDPSLQSNLYAAFFEAWRQNGNGTLSGVYFWNWDPNAGEVGPHNGANFSPQGQPAQAVVTANFGGSTPALQVSPASDIAATGLQGGPFAPSSFAFQLQASSGSVAYTVSGVPSWLTASSTSGTVTTATTTVTLSTNASANALSPGSYSATITLTDTTNSDVILALSAVLNVSQSTATLSVSIIGEGTVTSSPSGISCGATCSANFATGTQVALDATPASGFNFTGWGGACSGSGICQVTMNAATSVTANFTQIDELLTVNVSGSGTVISNPSGISCPANCSASFASGTSVTLSEVPSSGYIFAGWSGACSGAASCLVTMSAEENVSATFATEALTRTFVSSSGVDGNPCTLAQPCATFARAYTVTAQKGIIAALNPGKYGPLTIAGPITINGNGWSAITATPQGNGIIINAGSGNVILTGLEVDGANAAYNGIVFNSGSSLLIDNCVVKDFIQGGSGGTGTSGNGIWIAPTSGTIDFTILNTIAVDNAYAGISYGQPSGSATASGVIDHVIATDNPGSGIEVATLGGSGAAAITISNSVANNNTGTGITVYGSSYAVTLDRNEISNNATGVSVGANTSVLLSRSVITKNTSYGLSNSGTTGSAEDNRIYGNGADINGNGLANAQPQ
jgi:Fe-S cluster biogenesis protein NfuA